MGFSGVSPLGTVLAGARVLVTAQRRADDQAAALNRRGAEVVTAPILGVEAHIDEEQLLARTRTLLANEPDVVVITTGIGLRGWLDAADTWDLREAVLDMLARSSVIARGAKAVGALQGVGITPSWVAPGATSAEILQYLVGQGVADASIAVQQHGSGDDGLSSGLARAGANVTTLTVYRWGPPPHPEAVRSSIAELAAGRFDAVTFTSAPGAAAWVDALRAGGAYQAVADQIENNRLILVTVGAIAAEPLQVAGLRAEFPERGRLGSLVRLIADRLGSDSVQIPAGVLRVHATDAGLDHQALGLPGSSLAVLRLLASTPGEVVSREEILRVLPGDSVDPHAAEVAIARLREALASPESIATVIRRGYRLVEVG